MSGAKTTLSEIGERGWLRHVQAWFKQDNARFAIPMGDDAAALDWPQGAGQVVVSTDALIEGVHFRRDWTTMRDLGAKALAVNLSDLAAMAAEPVAAFLTLGVPPETTTRELREFFMGLREESRRWDCPLAGGDLTRAPQWTITVTVLGRPMLKSSGGGVRRKAGKVANPPQPGVRGKAAAQEKVRPGRLARRDAAKPDQTLYVTGHPGESGAGMTALTSREGIVNTPATRALIRRHIRPTPRLAEAAVLAHACPDLAMLDVSDGLWNDAGQLAEASGARVELELVWLAPLETPALESLARGLHQRHALEWILFGGEDYELLFATATPEEEIRAAWKTARLKTPLHRIGRIAKGRGVHLMGFGALELQVKDRTFRHF